MKRTKIDMNPERQIITNMIVSDQFLREIMPTFRIPLLKTEYAREVAVWIEEYWEKYKAAPGKDIQNIYLHKKQQLRNEDDAENIAEFLTRLSAEWEHSKVNNVGFAVTSAIEYLKTRSLEILRDQIDSALSGGNFLQGEQFVANYTRIAPPMGEGVNLLRDTAKIAAAFLEEEEVLFQFPGGLGVVAGLFHRGDFVSYLAPQKRGKTWHLWYTSETASYAGLKVIFFTMEMTENQMIRRAWESLVGAPRKSCEITIPYFEVGLNSEKAIIKHRTEHRKGVDTSNIAEIQSAFKRRFRQGGIEIVAFPAATSVDDIEACIDNYAYYEGFVADVIVIDYADLLTPSRGFKGEYRHQLNDIWLRLRRIAQERKVLVVTASQAEKSTFKTDVSANAVAEDIRKFGHVTCMLGLNQTEGEQDQQILRVGQIGLREGKHISKQAVVLNCYDIGRAVLDSRLENEVVIPSKEKKEGEDGEENNNNSPRKRQRYRE
jgi:hypothetical protein